MSTLIERIFETLEELNDEEFKRFKMYLRQPGSLGGQQAIPSGKLDPADKISTADMIVQTYTNDGAQIMVNVLTKMKKNLLLETFLMTSKGADPPLSQHLPMQSDTLPSSSSSRRVVTQADASSKHFVDHHRRKLIERVANVEAILEVLREEGAITQEAHAKVTSKDTNQEKMRELYPYLNTKRAKDVFFKGLQEYENDLLEELQ